jgi:hypothetical protein
MVNLQKAAIADAIAVGQLAQQRSTKSSTSFQSSLSVSSAKR